MSENIDVAALYASGWSSSTATAFVFRNDAGEVLGGVAQLSGIAGWIAYTTVKADAFYSTKEAAMAWVVKEIW